ncbi:MAG: hypothetical protein DRG83_15360 [Deltaproteobacteria bacterium]|nr:MAG: hypothetical protein DRG83_15360 [Deltaproteobacteria bacterium]
MKPERTSKIIHLIEKQINEIEELKKLECWSPSFKAWKRKTAALLERIFGEDSRQLKDFEEISYSPGIISNLTPESEFQKRYIRGWEDAEAILRSITEELLEFQGIGNLEEKSANAVKDLERIFDRFHQVARQLRNRREGRPTLDVNDEYDVQDLLHALLRLFFDDIRPEEWTPSYAGGSARMDFLLKNEKIVVEVKKTRDNLAEKQIGDQLIQDIARYKAHPDCDHLVCFVYDPEGKIGNPRGLEADLSQEGEGFKTSVYVRP